MPEAGSHPKAGRPALTRSVGSQRLSIMRCAVSGPSEADEQQGTQVDSRDPGYGGGTDNRVVGSRSFSGHKARHGGAKQRSAEMVADACRTRTQRTGRKSKVQLRRAKMSRQVAALRCRLSARPQASPTVQPTLRRPRFSFRPVWPPLGHLVRRSCPSVSGRDYRTGSPERSPLPCWGNALELDREGATHFDTSSLPPIGARSLLAWQSGH